MAYRYWESDILYAGCQGDHVSWENGWIVDIVMAGF